MRGPGQAVQGEEHAGEQDGSADVEDEIVASHPFVVFNFSTLMTARCSTFAFSSIVPVRRGDGGLERGSTAHFLS